MKKIFNDHIGIWFCVAALVAVAALVLSIKNRKDVQALAPSTPPAPQVTDGTTATE